MRQEKTMDIFRGNEKGFFWNKKQISLISFELSYCTYLTATLKQGDLRVIKQHQIFLSKSNFAKKHSRAIFSTTGMTLHWLDKILSNNYICAKSQHRGRFSGYSILRTTLVTDTDLGVFIQPAPKSVRDFLE